MNPNPYRQHRDNLKELLAQFEKCRKGEAHLYIEEEGFEHIIEYFELNNDYKTALEAAEIATHQFSYSAALLIKKAEILLNLRRYQEALDTLEYAEILDKSDYTLYILKTDAMLALDRQSEAAAILEEAVQRFDGPDRVDLLFELADVYDDYEEFEKIFDCLEMILRQDPTNEEALNKICFWTDFTGRNEESIRLHKWIIDEHPFCALAWFNLGTAYQGLKLYEKSIDAYQYAVAIDDKFDYAYRNLADAYIRIRNYKEAIRALEKVLTLSRPESVIYEAVGHCYDRMHLFEKARFYYKKASHLEPDDLHLMYRIAVTYMNQQNWKKAILCLEPVVTLDKQHPEYHLAMGRCLMEEGDIEKAIVYLLFVIKTRPKNINGWVELLNALFIGDQLERALEIAGVAYTQTDGKPIFLYYSAALLFTLGRHKEGLLTLERALNENPKHVKKFFEMNPMVMKMQSVIDLVAKYRKKKNK